MMSNIPKPKSTTKPLPKTVTTPTNSTGTRTTSSTGVRTNSTGTRTNSKTRQTEAPIKTATPTNATSTKPTIPKPAPTKTVLKPTNTNSAMTSTTTAPRTFLKKSAEPKGAFINAGHKNKKRSLLESTSFYMWEDILVYCVDSLESLVSLARVCKLFYKAVFERAKIMNFVITKFYGKELKENPAISQAFAERRYDLDNIIEFIKGCEMVRSQKKTAYFLENYVKIFEYGHIKENVLNKLIEKLQLRIDLVWNKKRPYYALHQENFPFKIKFSNNMSHIMLRVEDIKKMLVSDLSVIDLVITFKSRYLRRSIEMNYQIKKADLFDDESSRKSTTVFHYYSQKNLLFVYFHKDIKIQYMLCDISILELLNQLYNQVKARASKAIKAKRIVTPADIGLYEYIRQQLDFEIHFCVKNQAAMKFYFINTTSYPKEYDQNAASFRVQVNSSFLLKGAEFKLDDDLGINQVIKDFFLVDFVLKDKDNILIVYSGFMEMKELETREVQKYIENYMNYSDEWFKSYAFQYSAKNYSFMVTCTKDARRNDVLVHEIFIDIKKSIFEDLS